MLKTRLREFGEEWEPMGKDVRSRARTYVTNIGRYVKRVTHGNASVRDAVSGIAHDTKKLTRSVMATDDNGDHRESIKLTEQGRRAYNEKEYKVAENLFKRANLADPMNTLALTYLGHTAYKQGNQPDAVMYWRRAVAVDPDSEGADKARRKLERHERQAMKTVDELEKRLREGR